MSTYTVKKGDTLSEIGQRLGIDYKEIVKLNHISNPNLIKIGQVLQLPIKQQPKTEGGNKMSVNVEQFANDAVKLQQATGIPASITLGQIILESSGSYPGGLSGLAYNGKNLFGMKGSGTAGSITMKTNEFVNGQYVQVNASFAKYSSYYDSMVAHAKLLSMSRYAKYLQNAKSINEYAQGIKNGGYATDPNYVSKLLKIIDQYNLHRYDSGNFHLNH
jgi:flagellum-specific peptidoglycan hydrolase FlgJ